MGWIVCVLPSCFEEEKGQVDQEAVMLRFKRYDKEKEAEDKDSCFGKTVIQILRKLSARNQNQALMEIYQVLFKWQMEDCNLSWLLLKIVLNLVPGTPEALSVFTWCIYFMYIVIVK